MKRPEYIILAQDIGEAYYPEVYSSTDEGEQGTIRRFNSHKAAVEWCRGQRLESHQEGYVIYKIFHPISKVQLKIMQKSS